MKLHIKDTKLRKVGEGKKMIEFTPNLEREGMGWDLTVTDEFAAFLKNAIEKARDVVWFISGITKKIVEEDLKTMGLPVFTIQKEEYYRLVRFLVKTGGREPVSIRYTGNDEEAEYELIADTAFSDTGGSGEDGEFNVVISLNKHTKEGDYFFNCSLGIWMRRAERKTENLAEIAENCIMRPFQGKEEEEFLARNEKLKRLREHPDVKHLVRYSFVKDCEYGQEDGSFFADGPEDLCTVLIPGNERCSGFFVDVDEETGTYRFHVEFDPDAHKETFFSVFGKAAEKCMERMHAGDLVAYQTDSLDEAAHVLENLLDHYNGNEEYAVFPISGNEYVQMYFTGKEPLRLQLVGGKSPSSEAGWKNLRSVMYLIGGKLQKEEQ